MGGVAVEADRPSVNGGADYWLRIAAQRYGGGIGPRNAGDGALGHVDIGNCVLVAFASAAASEPHQHK
jgi:hypothetical protein